MSGKTCECKKNDVRKNKFLYIGSSGLRRLPLRARARAQHRNTWGCRTSPRTVRSFLRPSPALIVYGMLANYWTARFSASSRALPVL